MITTTTQATTTTVLNCNAQEFKAAARRVLPCAGDSNGRYAINSMFVDMSDRGAELVCTDGRQLAHIPIQAADCDSDYQLLIPKPDARTLGANATRYTMLNIARHQGALCANWSTRQCRKEHMFHNAEGRFPRWREHINNPNTKPADATIVGNVEDVLPIFDDSEIAGYMFDVNSDKITRRRRTVRLHAKPAVIARDSVDSNLGNVTITGAIAIGIDNRLILAWLKAQPSKQQVRIYLWNDGTALRADVGDCTYILMPMHNA